MKQYVAGTIMVVLFLAWVFVLTATATAALRYLGEVLRLNGVVLP